MADRRINQLTEAEDISDEDLFVIWKENISQTRSIAKGTMNLASKSYVDNLVASRVPDWNNRIAIPINQFTAGYTVPEDGLFVWYCHTSSGDCGFRINNIKIADTSSLDHNYANEVLPVGVGDVVKRTGTGNIVSLEANFVPYKKLS